MQFCAEGKGELWTRKGENGQWRGVGGGSVLGGKESKKKLGCSPKLFVEGVGVRDRWCRRRVVIPVKVSSVDSRARGEIDSIRGGQTCFGPTVLEGGW